jgi:Sulfotransferase family
MAIGQSPRHLADPAKSDRSAPVIILAYTGSGAAGLRPVLSTFPELACTMGTGILPLCHSAVSAWRTVDGRADAGLSPLALTSARALTTALVTAILAREGGTRWCETATAPPSAAEAFALLYPQAKFLTVHRRADTTIRAIIDSSSWGPTGPEFAPYVSATPANPIAALASYWITHTTGQLEFERAHTASCRRVRIEDLTTNPSQARKDIGDFLCLDAANAPSWLTDGSEWSGPADASQAPAEFPYAQLPAALLAQLNQLHTRLGYPPIIAAEG